MTDATWLDYDEPVFAQRARKLIADGSAFSFEVGGEAFLALKPLMLNGDISDRIALLTRPKLQPLAGVLSYAGVKGRRVHLQELPDSLRVTVSIADPQTN